MTSMIVTTAPKTASVNVRVNREIKDRSEKILNDIGLSMSDAVNTMLRQVIIMRGLPFRPKTERDYGVIYEDDLTDADLAKL